MEQKGEYNIKALEESDIVSAAELRKNLCGVYFLVLDRRVVYVGQSINIPSRASQHKKDKTKKFDKYYYVECEEEDLDEVEQFYIRKFKPTQNKKLYSAPKPKTNRHDSPVNWLKPHPVFSKFSDITLREWMKRAGLSFDEAINNSPRDLKTFGGFYRWIKRKFPYLKESQILPNEVTRYLSARTK